MSDPAKSTEIEDVLASIRKLVSVDPTGAMKDGKAGPQKLILTSEQRVGRTHDRGGRPSGPLVLNEASGPEAVEPVARSPAKPLKIVTESAEISTDKSPLEGGSDQTGAGPARAATLEARIAELEAAVSSQTSEFEPDGSEDLEQHRPDRVPVGRVRPDPSDDDLAQRVAEAARSTVDEADAAITMPVEDPDDATATASHGEDTADPQDETEAVVAEFVSRNRRARPQPEAEDAQVSADANDRIEIQSKDGLSETEEQEDVAASDDTDPDDDGSAQDDDDDTGGADEAALLDEEALRALVSEIVRSELQGALGERITRNVRKLVRREIMRAITVRDST